MAYPHFYSLFNYHLYSICQLYTVYPQSVRVVFRKTYSEPDAGYHFFCGKLWWTLIMTLLSWAFRRYIYYHVFFASGVCACSRPILVFHGRDMTWYRSQLPGCWLQLLVAAVAKFTAIHEENHPRMVYLKRMRGRDPLKKLKNQANLKIKWGQTPAFFFGVHFIFWGAQPIKSTDRDSMI